LGLFSTTTNTESCLAQSNGQDCLSLLSELGGQVGANRAQADRWIIERQRKLAIAGVRVQTFEQPSRPSLPHFTEAGESRLVADELLRAFQPRHEFLYSAGVFLRDFHEHLSILHAQGPGPIFPLQVRTQYAYSLLQWSIPSRGCTQEAKIGKIVLPGDQKCVTDALNELRSR